MFICICVVAQVVDGPIVYADMAPDQEGASDGPIVYADMAHAHHGQVVYADMGDDATAGAVRPFRQCSSVPYP